MVRLVLLTLFALMVFAASAAGTWFLTRQSDDPAAADQPLMATPPAPAQDPAGEATIVNQSPANAGATDFNGEAAKPAKPGTLPVAVRPRPMSIEELLRYGMGLNQREEALHQREGDLASEQLHVKLVLADLRGEQDAIEGLRRQVQSQLESADEHLQKIDAARATLAADREAAREDLESAQEIRIQIEEQQRENIKQTATWLQAMEPDKAADVLREMANDGRLDEGVKLLAQLEERDVAKILSALDDAKLVDQFIDRFQDFKRPPGNAKPKR